jgi:hypothetical protein
MLYLLDANVLIDANRDYYSISRIPEFWDWLTFQGNLNNIKIPIEIFDEIKNGNDQLATWAKAEENETALLLDEDVDLNIVRRVINQGYGNDLSDVEIEKLGNDPFLVAYALIESTNRSIVTTEISKPKRQRSNRHLPDVCSDFNISCHNTYELTRILDFRTHWKNSL